MSSSHSMQPTQQLQSSLEQPPTSDADHDKPRYALLSCTFGIYLILALFSISYMIRNGRLPNPHTYKPSAKMPFNLTNAMRHISHLAKRNRYVGTQALEDGMQYVFTELEQLKPIAEQNGYHLDLEFVRSNPSNYRLNVTATKKVVNSYDNLPNVVARLRPASIPHDTDIPSLLISAHVDSALASPGVSDILSGVGIVLEVARAAAATNIVDGATAMKTPIVFLLNGAEEPVLAAAHAFVTQHPWGRTPAAFINLESMGSGSAFHLFRVAPNNPWLGRVYAKAVSLPTGTVAATDVFNLNLIPADTDYTIFTRYGNIPGYDFAILDNGYVYHTRFDDLPRLDVQGVLHGGITTYELMMELAGPNDAIGAHVRGEDAPSHISTASAKLSAQAGLMESPTISRFAYFDIMYIFTVFYEEGVAVLIHSLIITVSILVCISKIGTMTHRDRMSCFHMMLVLPVTIIAGFASASFASLVYVRVLHAPVAWYGSTKKALVIFLPPALFGMCGVLLLLLPRNLRPNRYDHALVPCILLQVMLAATAVRQSLMMAYIPCSSLVVMVICLLLGNRTMPIMKHFMIMLVHATILEKLYTLCLSVFLPIIGRIKVEKVPHDTVIGIAVTILSMPYMLIPSIPLLTYYPQALRKLRGILFAGCLWIAAYFVLVAPILNGEPGRTPYSAFAPKRLIAIHFHSPQLPAGSVLHVSGLGPGEVNVLRLTGNMVGINKYIDSSGEAPTFGQLRSEASEPFRMEAPFIQSHYVFPSESKPDLEVPAVQLKEEVYEAGLWNVSFSVDAKDSHMITVRLPTGQNSSIVEWSFEGNVGEFQKELWFRHFGSAHLDFWVVVRGKSSGGGRPKVKAVVTSTRLGASRSSDCLSKLNLTDWESAVIAVASGIEVEI